MKLVAAWLIEMLFDTRLAGPALPFLGGDYLSLRPQGEMAGV